MASLFLSHKTYRENFILVGLILFKSTQASVLAFVPETTVMALIYASWVFYKRRLKVDNFIFILIYIYLALNLYYFISFKENDFFLSIYILIKMIYAYLTIKCVGASFFSIFEKITYYLALISLPLFIFQLLNYDLLFRLVGILQNNILYLEFRNDRFANFFIFTMESHGSILRNSGFAWEPKGFANFLVLAMLINLLNNNFKINRRFLIFSIALLTTTSTTGFIIAFAILPQIYIINVKRINKIVLLPVLIFVLIFVLNLDLGYKKIDKEIAGRYEYKELLEDAREFETRSLGRFPSFIVDFNDFIKRPIFGYGFNATERTQSEYTKLVRVNGISDLLAIYGLFGFLLISIAHYKSLNNYLRYYRLKGKALIFLMFAFIYFASTLTSHPFWMMFYFFYLIKLNPLELPLLNKIVFNEKDIDFSLHRSKDGSKALQTN
ncbi:hypothetical protein SAMN00777080_2680 [Aquiflexum balticum DSM 16537]|uniref:O-antigen ligase like membrane protein n=1 Tax=Aquiflexum balticum DSM 16537 TaxID=758820 RepID=A0A1W2H552_9BACT|nr:hypothetical protein [Aquiflexum balticum]SMD44065.1 hypothetical protein SAMN00777080_2680 [Aquiflexum balticum DSM 16537]